MSKEEKAEAQEFARSYIKLDHGDKRYIQGLMAGMASSNAKSEKLVDTAEDMEAGDEAR